MTARIPPGPIRAVSRLLDADVESLGAATERPGEPPLVIGLGERAVIAGTDKLAAMEQLTEHAIENMLRCLAEEKQVGLGKVAQPLRVAICGTTVSLPIFESVQMLGKEDTLCRIDITLKKFAVAN